MKRRILAVVLLLVIILLPACASGGADYSDSGKTHEDYIPPPTTAPDDGNYDYSPGDSLGEGEGYLNIDENAAKFTDDDSMLTFSLKVDTASYTNVQRYIESGSRPPKDAVRTEELINYFKYDGEMQYKEGPFSIYTEIGQSPFDANKQIAFLRIKTDDIPKENLPPCNLTFLIDTSGSMDSYDKLPLLKEAFSLLVDTLDEDDRVSIVTYAGSAGVVLDSVSGAEKERILDAIYTLKASGSTAGANGIKTAYSLAEKNFMDGGNNRVILATDGDFNVGISNTSDLSSFIANKRDSGVYLSILGFGTGNIRDDIMETLSKDGNGNYSYINSVSTAKKVLVDELGSNLYTVAEDVKAQVEFNAENVKSYRLIGYENRKMSNRDFDDDKKDAGEIGVGTDVVVLFEIELNNTGDNGTKYGGKAEGYNGGSGNRYADELFELRIRYKDPGKNNSRLIEYPVTFSSIASNNSRDFLFACSVAGFGHLLRGSEYSGDITVNDLIRLAEDARGVDKDGYRYEYLSLLMRYRDIR